MCGIVGYVGDRDITSILLVGLERLSYRGYDSSGIAVLSEGELSVWKKAGKIHELSKLLGNMKIQGSIGIGHTRWATHGIPDEINAHPHVSHQKKIAVVHNGIIENYAVLKEDLKKKGYFFRSQTDTEVLTYLIDDHFVSSLEEAVLKTVPLLTGSYAIAVISESDPEKIVIARHGSPLILGMGKNENYISSDINALLSHTKNMVFLENKEVGVITKNNVSFFDFSGQSVHKKTVHVAWDPVSAEKSGFEHFMMKEIYEQPAVIRNIISKYVQNGKIYFPHIHRTGLDLTSVNRIIIQACGTSWHAGLMAKYLIENYVRIITEVDISSEFRYRKMITQGNDLVMAISQSGETADTLACIREAKSKFFPVLSLVNVKNSTMDRESDGVIYSHAGQEVGVASTKNFVAQLTCIFLFTLYLAQLRGTLQETELQKMLEQLCRLPEYLTQILDQRDTIVRIAEKYAQSREFLFIGRGLNYPSALEGALKLKEISYIHATGYAAGELKHGPIALIDEHLPIVCISPESETYEKMVSNIQEVKARKGKTIIIATEGNKELLSFADDIIFIPKIIEELSPILVAIPLQILAYEIAIRLGCDVDQPRNLAKSVTVE